jgi:hypothetical protein
MPSTVQLLGAGVVIYVAVSQYRRLRDFDASFVGRTAPTGGVER